MSTIRDADGHRLPCAVAPIPAPNGRPSRCFAALVAQGETQAASEVAHLGNRGEARAEDYTERLAMTLGRRGYAVQGGTKDIEGMVGWRTRLSHQNRLPGEWNALTEDQRLAWDEGDFSLTHTFNQVRPLTDVGLDHDDARDR